MSLGAVSVLAIAMSLGVVSGLAMFADSTSCRAKATAMSLPYSWGPMQGCMVKVGSDWLPLDNYRGQQSLSK